MPRVSKPWRRGGGAWYAKVAGRTERLAPASADFAEARRALRRLQDAAEQGRRAAGRRTVAELVARFLAHERGRVERRELAPATLDHYRANLRFFGPALGLRPAEDVQPHEVKAFLDAHPTWNATKRAGVVTAIKRVFRWARKDGLIAADPLADLDKPRPLKREAIPTPEGAAAALDACASPEFWDYLWVLHETGCRPGEARDVEARDLDLGRGLWHRRGKTTGRTGVERVVYLTPELVARLGALADLWPEGPLLRNTRGDPWKPNAVACQMRRLRDRINRTERERAAAEGRDTLTVAGPELAPYALRHRFATDALLAGADAPTVATMLGHQSLKMLMERYSHLIRHGDHMRAALAKVRGRGDD